MKKHEWHTEFFTPKGFWNTLYSQPEALSVRLSEIENQGFEIFSVSTTHTGGAFILYRRLNF